MIYTILISIICVLAIYCFAFSHLYIDTKSDMEHYRKLYNKECMVSTNIQMDIDNKRKRISQLEHQIDDLYNEKNIVREARQIKDINATVFIDDKNLEYYTEDDIKKKLAIKMADELDKYMEYHMDSESLTHIGRGFRGRIKIISKEE